MIELRWLDREEPGVTTVWDDLGKLVHQYPGGYSVTRRVLQYRVRGKKWRDVPVATAAVERDG